MDFIYRNGATATSVFIASFLLAACGGGGSGGSAAEVGAETTDVADESQNEPLKRLEGGSFLTEVEYNQGGSDEGITFLSPNGDFVTAFGHGDISFGALEFQDGEISGSATDFSVQGDSWQKTEGQIAGTVEASDKATLEGTAPGFTSSISLERRNEFSSQGLTKGDLSGTYTMTDGEGGVLAQVTVDSAGLVTGTDNPGCVLNGELRVPDSSINLFEMEYTASSCSDGESAGAEDRDGDFFALGTYDPAEGKIEFAANNQVVATLFIGMR